MVKFKGAPILRAGNYAKDGLKVHLTNSNVNPKDCLDEEIRKADKSGREYSVYTLYIKGKSAVFRLYPLFEVALAKLIDQFGDDSESWNGNSVEIKGVPRGEFYDWDITPIPEFEEEEVEENKKDGI